MTFIKATLIVGPWAGRTLWVESGPPLARNVLLSNDGEWNQGKAEKLPTYRSHVVNSDGGHMMLPPWVVELGSETQEDVPPELFRSWLAGAVRERNEDNG